MGISFAIPIDVAMNVAEQLKNTGKVQRGQLGVIIQEVSYGLAQSFGLDKASGALIAKILPGSPAERAGLQAGDIIRSLNGEEIRSSGDLPVMVGAIMPGKEASLGVWRKGEEITVKIKLGNASEQLSSSSVSDKAPYAEHQSGTFSIESVGVTLQTDTDGNGGRLIVVRVSDAAQRAGLRRGDEILAVGQIPVNDETGFRNALDKAGKNIPLLVMRQGNTLFIALTLQ